MSSTYDVFCAEVQAGRFVIVDVCKAGETPAHSGHAPGLARVNRYLVRAGGHLVSLPRRRAADLGVL